MAELANDPEFVAFHLSPRPLRFTPTEGKNVVIPVPGKPTDGFYVPPAKGNHDAVVMVHEWWGLNDYIRREAERLHDKTGYAVLAIDLFEGKSTADPKVAGKLTQTVTEPRGEAIVRTAVAALKKGVYGQKARKVGSVGFCFGGGWSYQTAVQGGKNVQACVMFYGMPDTSTEAISKLKAPVLFIYGTQDKWINASVADRFKSAMEAAHKPVTIVPFDANHGFANPSNPVYNETAANEAWAKTLAFFKRNLK